MKNIDRAWWSAEPGQHPDGRAGRAVAEATREYLGYWKGRKIISLAGGGKYGGHAIVAARYLHDWGASVKTACAAKGS
jgi:NAD(P)H-hydrate repair Nnr-like enzyme with NAD(P)H-hydrate epimerase domain